MKKLRNFCSAAIALRGFIPDKAREETHPNFIVTLVFTNHQTILP